MNKDKNREMLRELAFKLSADNLVCYWSADPYWQTWLTVGDDTGVASINYDLMRGLGLSTVHKPNSVSGTGYHVYAEMQDITAENVREVMSIVVPNWAQRDVPPKKYKSVHDYIDASTLDYIQVIPSEELFFWDVPFRGSFHSTDMLGRVAYTQSLYPDGVEQGHNLTLKQYAEVNPNDTHSEPVPWSEAVKVLDAYERETYIDKPATVIDKARFWEMLEVLPPCRWNKEQGLEYFYVSEAMTGTIHSWFINDGKTYVEFLDDKRATFEHLAARFREAIK